MNPQPVTTPRRFGCHVSCAGGLANALKRGEALGVNAIQIHPSAPQRWNLDPYPIGIEVEYQSLKPQVCVEAVYFHGIYLINLATPDPRKQQFGVRSLINDLELAHRIGAAGVIFHVGSLKDEPDEEAGFSRAASLIRQAVDEAPGSVKLLLEVSAGSGKVIGSRFAQLARIDALVDRPNRVGFALDTQHLWASGHDLVNDLDGIIESFGSCASLLRIEVIHLNDSKTKLGSTIDRHENLGAGLIGYDTLRKVVQHPALAHAALILETPRMKSPEEAILDVQVLREMMGNY